MANISNWKGFEWEVARALGGRRRLRTMESFGKTATDVYFPKSARKMMPFLSQLKIECKKRRQINIHSMFAEAILKYRRKPDDKIILATRVPATKKTGEKWKRLKGKFKRDMGKKLKRSDFINPLVTVDLEFFVQLLEAWKWWHQFGAPIIIGTKFKKGDIYKEILNAYQNEKPGKVLKFVRRFPRTPNHSTEGADRGRRKRKS
jgi:hypothetical protein